jgi:hypothetical protein
MESDVGFGCFNHRWDSNFVAGPHVMMNSSAAYGKFESRLMNIQDARTGMRRRRRPILYVPVQASIDVFGKSALVSCLDEELRVFI